jgi:sialate O-acetylesterase
MRKRINCLLTLVFIFSFLNIIKAEIRLPAIFGDNMVLQQQAKVPVWGWTTPGSAIKLKTSWDHGKYLALADKDGKWIIHVLTPKAGGPYEISISDGKLLVLKNILIGEVWLCSGQSNMGMTIRGKLNSPVNGSNEVIASANSNPDLRFYTVEPAYSVAPKINCQGRWSECNSETVSDFSAVAFFYGQYLTRTLHVPIGLINCSYGGSMIHAWMSPNMLNEIEKAPKLDSAKINSKTPQKSPTVLFNAMLSPIIGYRIKGCIWYQGESDRGNPLYEALFPAMVKGWRTLWGVGDFPFYYAQIAPLEVWGENNALMRETQLKAAKEIPNSGMAVLMGLGEKDNIHPAEKRTVAQRLAYWALAKTYHMKNLACNSPELNIMTISNDTVKLTFNYAPLGLSSFGKELDDFEIAGEDQKFYRAKAKITLTGVTLTCEEVQKPVAVRYAFYDYAEGSLFSVEGLPVSSFRTDNWEIKGNLIKTK